MSEERPIDMTPEEFWARTFASDPGDEQSEEVEITSAPSFVACVPIFRFRFGSSQAITFSH